MGEVKRGRRNSYQESGRDALLRESLKFFTRYGYEGVSLRQIANQAHVDMALIGKTFGSKDKLWLEVLELLILKLHEDEGEIKDIDNESISSPRNGIIRLIKYLTQLNYEMPELTCFFIHECINPGSRQDVILEKVIMPFRSATISILKRAMASGVVKGKDPEIVLGLLFSALSLPLISPVTLTDRRLVDQQMVNDVTNEMVSIFVSSQSE